jgi:hypothetical protein
MSPLKSNPSKSATNNSRNITLVTMSASTPSECLRSQHSLIMPDIISGMSLSRIFVARVSPLTPRTTPPRRPLPSTPRSSSTTPVKLVLVTPPPFLIDTQPAIWNSYLRTSVNRLDLQLAGRWNIIFRTNV